MDADSGGEFATKLAGGAAIGREIRSSAGKNNVFWRVRNLQEIWPKWEKEEEQF